MKLNEDIAAVIRSAAARHGLDPTPLLATAFLESRGNPEARNKRSSAGGLFQFIDSTAADYGLADRFDPSQASDAAARLQSDNAAYLRKRLGREPTGAELYLAHQQGMGGAASLLSDPNRRAVDVVGADAVLLNLPAEVIEAKGGIENVTAGDFAALWTGKADKAIAAFGGSSDATAAGMGPVAGAAAVERGTPPPLQSSPFGPDGRFTNEAFLAALGGLDGPAAGGGAPLSIFDEIAGMPGMMQAKGVFG